MTMENLSAVYDKLAADWALKIPEETWGFGEFDKFIKLLGEGRVLDLGCASGNHSKLLVDAGLNVVGIDISPKMIEVATRKVPDAKFFVGDTLDLQFPRAYFDSIYTRAALLHIPKRKIKKVVGSLHEILRKKGIIYVALKEGKGEREIFDEEEKVSRFSAFYKESEFKKFLEEANFEVIETTYAKTERNRWLQFFAEKV